MSGMEALQGCRMGFIGGGAMAEALIAGLKRAGFSGEIAVSEPNLARRQRLEARWRVRAVWDNAEAAACDCVVIAVKPQQAQAALAPLAGKIPEASTVISIMAGVPIRRIRLLLDADAQIVRAMPNTPALVGQGIAALYTDSDDPQHRARAEALLRACGEVVWLDDEALMHAVTAVSGSGPAYFFLFAEILEEAARRLGLPEPTAKLLVRRTMRGAAEMLLAPDADARALRAQVTSPGGTTEAAVQTMLEANLPQVLQRAVSAAAERSRELARA